MASLPYTLTTARSYLSLFLRNGGQDPLAYSDAQKDLAFQQCADELIRESRIDPVIGTMVLQNGSSNLPAVPSVIEAFRTDRAITAYLSSSNVQVQGTYLDPNFPYYTEGAPMWSDIIPTSTVVKIMPYPWVLDNQRAYPQNGQPTMIGFNQLTGTGICFPTPNQDYTLTLQWVDLFSTWTPGTQGAYSSANSYTIGDVVSNGTNGTYQSLTSNNSSNTPVTATAYWAQVSTSQTYAQAPGGVTFNLPNDYLRAIFTVGAVAVIQNSDPTNSFAEFAKGAWQNYLISMRGKGTLGQNSVPLIGRGLTGQSGVCFGW